MIVLATHDRIDLLESMLNRFNEINLNGHEVLVIDTNSTNQEYLDYFNQAKEKYNFNFIRLNYTCWDSGAYIYAFQNHPSDKYIFLQDSLEITNPNLFVDIDNLLNQHDVVPFFNFKYIYDHDQQKEWAEDGLEINSTPEYGIFGPLFGATKSILDKIPVEWLKHPTEKYQGNGMERRWSLMFHLINASKRYLSEATGTDLDNIMAFIDRNKQNINKIYLRRD
jgi:hypothetical protein